MRERPILFSAPMVSAILAGTKTMTRRIVKLDRAVGEPRVPPGHVLDLIYPGSVQHYGHTTPEYESPSWRVQRLCDASCDHIDDVGPYDGRHCVAWGPMPYGVGDRLWVKETWRTSAACDPLPPSRVLGHGWPIWYAADNAVVWSGASSGGPAFTTPGKTRVSIHMPRAFSRITLEVTGVRVERLHDITDDDARAEGVEPYTPPHGRISPEQHVPGPGFGRCRLGDQPHRLPFADLWSKINGEESWVANPWVWVVTFSRVTP